MLPESITKPRLAFVTALLAIALSLAGLWVWAQMDPPRTNPHVNITRSQYEQALAKWQAHKVEEYEVTTNEMAIGGGSLTLHVSEHGNKIVKAGSFNRPLSHDIIFLKPYTIEGLFAEVDGILAGDILAEMVTGHDFLYGVAEVTFDPELGYPKRIRSWVAPREVAPTDTESEISVVSLKIIKKGE
jgi:hypothetical protein